VCLGLPTDASDEARTRNAFSRATHLGRGLAIPPAKLFEVGTDYTRRFLTCYGASREDGGVGTVVLGLPCQETDPFLDGRTTEHCTNSKGSAGRRMRRAWSAAPSVSGYVGCQPSATWLSLIVTIMSVRKKCWRSRPQRSAIPPLCSWHPRCDVSSVPKHKAHRLSDLNEPCVWLKAQYQKRVNEADVDGLFTPFNSAPDLDTFLSGPLTSGLDR
jgi:hypothetical protein